MISNGSHRFTETDLKPVSDSTNGLRPKTQCSSSEREKSQTAGYSSYAEYDSCSFNWYSLALTTVIIIIIIIFVYLRLSNATDNIRYKKIDVGIYMDIHTIHAG